MNIRHKVYAIFDAWDRFQDKFGRVSPPFGGKHRSGHQKPKNYRRNLKKKRKAQRQARRQARLQAAGRNK